ncbi:hypothetical protein CLAC_12180 [Corynebacterium lactis RW2-5]|uniref:Uncharacterized protein n=1 Tax=Corynebacterium lactis RW2-5 TaxID=1408189 RepID=A0A0K2H3Y4_9CORY|nr:hypothetical protein CLAC_12180 [Corynebacterium lactis RW2-5]
MRSWTLWPHSDFASGFSVEVAVAEVLAEEDSAVVEFVVSSFFSSFFPFSAFSFFAEGFSEEVEEREEELGFAGVDVACACASSAKEGPIAGADTVREAAAMHRATPRREIACRTLPNLESEGGWAMDKDFTTLAAEVLQSREFLVLRTIFKQKVDVYPIRRRIFVGKGRMRDG